MSKVIIYLLRRDLRLADNPIFHHLSVPSNHDFTHLLPVYVVPPHQMEVSGFIKDESPCPYPQARSTVGGFWRCGPHRARFIGEAVWDTKESLQSLGSGLLIRVGPYHDVIKTLVDGLKDKGQTVGAVWITQEEGVEEARDEQAVAAECEKCGVAFKSWCDEKYFIDDRKLSYEHARELPDVFTTYRKSVEPLNERPLPTIPKPPKSSLPAFPDDATIPAQGHPFEIASTEADWMQSLVTPVADVVAGTTKPEEAESAHPFKGGETAGRERLVHLVKNEVVSKYKETRNGLVGTEFSTKLSAYLAQGCVTARQVHEEMCGYENGTNQDYSAVPGFGHGENEGTKAVRFELLWRDYMRLCTRKFKHKLFRVDGFRGGSDGGDKGQPRWKAPDRRHAAPQQDPSPDRIAHILERFQQGNTGMGLIDASQRELLHTGYTSNRARQNVASFLAKHLGIDWRYGAEWYEMLLTDYDVSSNWANWQYVAGVGNDPRGEARIFNPVKQAFDYDKEGKYVRTWVPEVKGLERMENVFQAWTASEEDLKAAGLQDNIMVKDPIKRIQFSVDGKPRGSKKPFVRRRGNGRRPGPNLNGGNGSPGRVEGQGPAIVNGNLAPDGQARAYGPGDGAPRGGYGRGGRGRGFRGNRGFMPGRGGAYGGQNTGSIPTAMQWTPPAQTGA